jgi:hypothetical protein
VTVTVTASAAPAESGPNGSSGSADTAAMIAAVIAGLGTAASGGAAVVALRRKHD